MNSVHLGQRQPWLILVLAILVGIADRAGAVTFEKEQLCDALIGVNFRGQGGRVAYFERDLAAPFRLDGGYIDNDPAAGVRAFSDANCQDLAGYRNVFNCLAKGEGIRRNQDVILTGFSSVDRHERILRKSLWIDNFRIDVGENLKNAADANVVSIARDAEADLARSLDVLLERFDADQFTDFNVTEDRQ